MSLDAASILVRHLHMGPLSNHVLPTDTYTLNPMCFEIINGIINNTITN